MTRQEFSRLMAFLSAAIDKPVSKATVEAYFEMLGDLHYGLAMAAVQKIIATDEFPVLPTIGKIRKAAADLKGNSRISAAEAWGIVIKSIKDYGYYREAEALQSMPEDVARVVRWMGWQELCHSDNVDVIRGQFLKMYEAETKRHQDFAVLPPAVRDFISDAAKTLKLIDEPAAVIDKTEEAQE